MSQEVEHVSAIGFCISIWGLSYLIHGNFDDKHEKPCYACIWLITRRVHSNFHAAYVSILLQEAQRSVP